MVIHTQKDSLVQALSSKYKNDSIGFVPTMGALHQGHISLINKALSENEIVVVSIFVNPTQFNNASDLQKYPRTPQKDISLLETLNGEIILYLPEISDVYEDTVAAQNFNFGGLEFEMEGKHRQGHFDGVGTVVSKLFKIVKPTNAYFGEKDFQQLQIVKKLVEIENLPVNVVGCPILREENGLAMSSRNKRLSNQQFKDAATIYQVLKEVQAVFSDKSIAEINALVTERFLQNANLKLEYFEIANEDTLKTATTKKEGINYRAFIAVFAGEIRLIDNISLN